MENIQKYTDDLLNSAIHYAPKILGTLIVFIVGLWLTNVASKVISKVMKKRNLDISLQSFLISFVSVSLKIILLITVAGMLGMETTSFVAVLGVAGLAVGLALQGSLSNFAGGVLVLVFKPFKIGDLIECGSQFGEVIEIQIFNTVLLTPENKTVILPNGIVSNGTIVNFSRHGNLRVDITVAVAPDNDINKVRQVIQEVCVADPKVLKDPAPSVNILKMENGMVILTVRPYATPTDFWTVFFGIQEKIKTAFEQNNISSPVPHRIIINK